MPSFWDEVAGGTVAGVVGMSLVYPLDTVKSRWVNVVVVPHTNVQRDRQKHAGQTTAASGARTTSLTAAVVLTAVAPAAVS